jgi:endoglucanase
VTYLGSTRAGRDPALVTKLEESAVAAADAIVTSTNAHAYGRGVGSSYYWGINGVVASTTVVLQLAHRIQPRDEYLDAVVAQVDHLLGRNATGRSQVTGVGYFPPAEPHHRPSVSDGVIPPWPGLLVGGAWPEATSWQDEHDDFKTNEVAINWSAALVYALAGLVP